MAKFIGQTGLIYLWGKIKTYVANYVKIVSSTGKDTITAGNNSIDVYDWAQASTKPSYNLDEISAGTTNKAFTSTEKTKLSGIASGAEVNQNAFSNVKVGSTTIAADGKTDTLEIAGGGDVSVTPDATNDKVTISVTTPKNTSDLTNDSGFITLSDVPDGISASTTTPKMDGTAAVGTETAYARGDHRHPTDTSRQAVINDLSDIRSGAAAGATAYQLPSGGIPKTDLASAVQTSLGKADTAMQSSDLPIATSTTPKMDGTAAVGSETKWAKGDHVHPTDTSRAPLASPTFTGTPKAPTATAGTNTTQVATTAFVTTAIQNAQTGAAMFQGTAPTTFAPTNYKKGYYWIIGTAGTYCGETCEAGDMIYAVADYNSAYNTSDFNVVQRNLDIAEMSTSEMDTATSNWT